MADQPELSQAWAKRRIRLSRRIEEETLRCFLEHGIDKVTVDDIAAATGISRRTFYRYFPNPLEVLAELPRRGLDRLIANFEARPASETMVEAFVGALEQSAIAADDLPVRVLSAEVLRRWPQVWRHTLGGMQNESIQRYAAIIARRLAAQGRDTAPAGVLAATFSAVIVQLTSEHRSTGAFAIHPEEFRNRLKAMGEILGE